MLPCVLRIDKVIPSLSQPFTGTHEILSRDFKHITIIINGKNRCVSLDRVKPAFVFSDLPSNSDNLDTKSFSVDSQPVKLEDCVFKSM